MELIDGDALMDFLQTTKETFSHQALNIPDPIISVKVYAMADAVDKIMDQILEGTFDIDTPDKEDMN